MNLENQNNNMQELDQRVEQLLTPRFAPSAEGFKLQKPQQRPRHSWLLNTARIGGLAAVLVIGIFALISPTSEAHAKSAEEIVFEALEKLQNLDSFRAEFKAKIVARESKDKTDIYDLSLNGEDVTGVFMVLKNNDKVSFRIEWSNGVVQLFDSFEMRYKMWKNGELVCNEPRTSINAKFTKLLTLDGVKQEFGSNSDVRMKEQENNITLSLMDNDTEEIEAIFSRDNGRLEECGARRKDSSGKWVKLLSAKIDYSTHITKAEITAVPKK